MSDLIFEEKENSNDDHKRFGIIQTSIFHYITPMMLVIMGIVCTIIIMNVSTLRVYFETNVYLNGLIIFLLFFALTNAFHNNFLMFRTARFLKRAENIENQEEITNEEVDKLHEDMPRQAYLIDTQNMRKIMDGLKTFEKLIFTDNDARLIKSKLGFRIRLKKSSVGFMAGILVMLGLLGTFLGLLKTIDSVGVAMAGMSNIGAGDEGVTPEQMSGFISSLSTPLQGMGLAFSSSLFGLSGSLLIGFFNHLCGGAQDKFIENTGRWIDDKIPGFKPGAKKDGAKATKDDMHQWITGFVYLSVKANKRVSNLTRLMLGMMKDNKNSDDILLRIEQNHIQGTKLLNETQNIILSDQNNASHHRQKIIETLQNNTNALTAALQNSQSTDFGPLQGNLEQMTNTLSSLAQSINTQQAQSSTSAQHQVQGADPMTQNKLDKIMVDMERAFSKMDDVNEEALKKMFDINDTDDVDDAPSQDKTES